MDDLSVLAVLYILPLIDANCLQDPIRVEKTNLIVSIKIFMFLFPFMCWFFNYGSLLVYLLCNASFCPKRLFRVVDISLGILYPEKNLP